MVTVKKTDKLVFDLEILQVDYSEQKKNELKKKISEKYNVPLKNVEVNFIPITLDKNGEKLSLTSDVIKNIQDPKFQQNLFKEYIELKDIKDINIEEIIDIDKSVNAFIDFDSYSKYKSYKFKRVKWDNYLSYGKGNSFDFTKLHGLVLLNGYPENQCGKTTFAIDLLRFALFGKADKSPTLDSVFNRFLPEETEVMVEAVIEIDGVEYVIRRTITRPPLKKRTNKSKAKQKIEYFKIIGNEYELIENCEAESATQTNNIIRDSVGNVEDFDLIMSATSYSLGDLLRMGQTDKGKLFSKWLGLVTIEEKERIAKDLYKTKILPTLLPDKYNKTTFENEINDMKNVIASNNKEIINLQEKMNDVNINIDNFNKDKLNILSNKKEIKDTLTKTDISTVEHNISMIENSLSNYRSQMNVMKEEYGKIKDVSFDKDKYDENRVKLNEIQKDNAEIKVKINHLKDDNKRINKLIEEKICPTCGHEIDIVEHSKFIEKNNNDIQELINSGINNKKEIDRLTCDIEKMEHDRDNVNLLDKLKLKMTAVKAQIENCKLQLQELNRVKDEIETNKENIRYNNEIDNKIRIVDENIKNETNIKENYIRNIQTLKNEIDNYNKSIDEREKLIIQLVEQDKIVRNWTIYQQLVGKNGIVKIALKKALPLINNEIARILNGLCDFNVEINVSDDGKVMMEMVKDGERLDLGTAASGFETVMASMAIRNSLASMATFAKPNCTIMDEVLEGVAVSNYDNVKELFNRIVQNYDFILHITHNEMLADWHENVITVQKQGNISVIGMK